MPIPCRKLTSDQLGKKGEDRFSELCSDAGLICNKSNYDRTGWDFLVEFPFEQSNPKTALDKRQVPLSCHMQVKTMWMDSNGFSVRLSSAERLAKEPKPTFFCIFKVDDDLQFVEAHVIPVLDLMLERILKRLREEHVKSPTAGTRLNRKTLRIALDSSTRLSNVTGQALRDKIVSYCGEDFEACMRNKNQQLQKLGFEASAYQAETIFTIQENDEIVEVLLGLKPAQITSFKTYETRFGIKLPVEEFTEGLMHIEPEPADQCTIVMKGEGVSIPATFSAEIFVPPIPWSKDEALILIKAKLFEIRVRRRKFNFNTNSDIAKIRQTPEQWINFFRMLAIFSKGGTMTVMPSCLARAVIPIKLEHAFNATESAMVLRAFEGAETLFKLSGTPAPMLIQSDILSVGNRIIGIAELFSDPSKATPLRFRSKWEKETKIPETIKALYIDAIEIAGVRLAFSLIAEMACQQNGAELQWTSRTLTPREIVSVRDLDDDYEAFANRSKTETAIDTVMMATYAAPEQIEQ